MEWAFELVAGYGLPALALLSLLAATLIPLSSEALVLGAVALGIPAGEALIAASLGNCSGCALNYLLGRLLRERYGSRMEQSRFGRQALRLMEKYGSWSLLASCLPFVGDPLTIAAGIARLNPVIFALIVFGLRIGRYLLVLSFV